MGDTFGELLRRHRLSASLTQEALAERASLSATAVAALERGRNRSPRMSTLRQLGRALELTREELAQLSLAAASESERAATPGPTPVDMLAARPPPTAPPPGDPDRPGLAPSRPTGSSVPLPFAAARRWRTGFVGREEELDHLRSAWHDRRRLCEVVGESGIGKTRLVAELARRARDDGATVLWGRCSSDGLGPYLPFVEMLRHLTTHADGAELVTALAGRGELRRLVPEIAARVGSLPAPAQGEAGEEQRLLFESVSRLVAAWTPMLMVVDDLHWADDASLALLGYLVRDHDLDGLVIVVTARDLDPAKRGLLVDLGRDTDVMREPLRGLGEHDLAALAADLVGSASSPGVTEYLMQSTAGNPFFAEETILHLLDSGLIVGDAHEAGLRVDAQTVGVPERIRETVIRRLLSLSGPGLELLSVGSVIGREFDLSVAAAVSGLDGSDLVDAADDGLLSGMVVETGPGRLAFSHGLVRDAVGSRLSHARLALVHRRVAGALEERWPGDAAIAADLARHWTAVALVDPTAVTTAATWAVRAGDVALASAAAEEAISRYEQASALWATTTVGHTDALIRLGVALQHNGQADEADGRFREATHLAVALGDPQLQARAAIGLGRRYPYWETDLQRVQALEAALASLPPDEGALRVELMGLLVTHLINGFEPQQARRRDSLARELSAIVADPEAGPEMLLAVGHTRIYDCIEDPATLTSVADRLGELAVAGNDLRVLAGARFAHALAALDAGEMTELRLATDRYAALAERLDDPGERGHAARVCSTIMLVEGRYDEAAALSDRALGLGQVAGDLNAELLHYAQGLLRAVDQGLAGAVLPLLMASTDYQHILSFTAGTALCAALAGEHQVARDALEQLIAGGTDDWPRGADRLAPTAFLAHTCAIVGGADAAARLYEALLSTPATVVRVGPLAGWWGPVDHHLGALARILGRQDEAEARLRRALVIEQRMGARPFEARTRGELARVLGGTDRDGARQQAEQAAAIARAVGADGITSEIDAVRLTVGVAVGQPATPGQP